MAMGGRCLAAALGAALLALAPSAKAQAAEPAPLRISEAELYDRIYAAWLGQLVGNIYGLPHENIHIDEPGPDAFPYGYDFLEIPYYQSHFGATRMTGVMDAFGGAFSDDDTDIEYIYLQLMEQAGLEPTYGQIRSAWMAHVDDWVWIANRQALALMHMGYAPPYTGARELNPEWFQIDPQLINEIWAITAPGMVDYAAAKSDWAARVSADGVGTEPTIAYGAMFAAAFYEPDVEKLIDIGAAALPPGAKFREVITFAKALKRRYPDDWRAARREVAEAYYVQAAPRSIWDANLNGACAILALLYGEGDFQRTLDLASAMGFDADNQAATVAGLLGAAHGLAAIPDALLRPVEGWALPFNDRYLNRSRRDLPSASLRDMAQRTTTLAIANILAQGGRQVGTEEQPAYEVNPRASFKAPFELVAWPPQTLLQGAPVDLPLHAGGSGVVWTAQGLPPGVGLDAAGRVTGTPTQPGDYEAELTATPDDGRRQSQRLDIVVEGRNLALQAGEVLGPAEPQRLELLRDGVGYGGTSVESPKAATKLEIFGYRWSSPQTIGSVLLTVGRMGEYGGWMTSLSVEQLDGQGRWVAVPGVRMSPEPVLQNDKHLRPHYGAYRMDFPPVQTLAIRIKGLNGGEGDQRYVSLSELGVFP